MTAQFTHVVIPWSICERSIFFIGIASSLLIVGHTPKKWSGAKVQICGLQYLNDNQYYIYKGGQNIELNIQNRRGHFIFNSIFSLLPLLGP